MGVVKRQGIKNTISSYAGMLIGFVSLLIIQPKFLKPEEIGLARVLFSFSVLVASFIPLGISNVAIKYFPLYKDEKTGHHGFFGFILIFPIIGFILSATGMVIFREFIIAQYRRESPLIIDYFNYVFPFSLFIAFTIVISTYLSALFKSTVPSYLSDVYVRIAFIGLVVAYYFQWITMPQFIGGYVLTYGVQVILLIIYLLTEDSPSLKIDWTFFKGERLREMIGFGLMLSVASVANLGLKTLDSILIGKFLPLGFVGVYAIVSFIPTVIETPLNALDRIVSSKIAHAVAKEDFNDLKDIFYKSVRYLTVLGGLLFVLINCNIIYLLRLVGKDYQQGVEVVWIISIGAFANMMGGANSSIVFYSSKYWKAGLLLIMLVIITFINNMLLIPLLGINGAAVSMALSAVLYTLIKFFIVYRRFGYQPYGVITIKNIVIIVACIALNFAIPAIHSDELSIIVRSIVLGGTYLALVYFLKIVPELHRYLPWVKGNTK